jgi:Holliday junction resolvase-like predicted endonuclease
MSFERDFLISILDLSRQDHVTLTDIRENTGLILDLVSDLAQKYIEAGYFLYENNMVIVKSRIQLAVKTLELGADLKKVCDFLSWSEFEDISREALEASKFRVVRNFRFKSLCRRWEIDLLGFKKPLILSIDCKHWQRGWDKSSIEKIVDSQITRTRALMEVSDFQIEKMGITNWKKLVLVPAVFSLFPGPFKFYQRTPVVPVLQIRNFLNNVFLNLNSLKSFSREIIISEF